MTRSRVNSIFSESIRVSYKHTWFYDLHGLTKKTLTRVITQIESQSVNHSVNRIMITLVIHEKITYVVGSDVTNE
jgi:uncharacterized protein YcfL